MNKEELAKQMAAAGIAMVADTLDGLFKALADNKVTFFEGLSLGGQLVGNTTKLAPLIMAAIEADWDQKDLVPILQEIADELQD